jgi:MoxR-like ATPase
VALSDITDREAVLRAMAEADEIGEHQFLERYGFGESRRYRVLNEDKSYPSKAVLAAAHGYQFPARGPLRNTEFSGGTPTTTKARELGFEIVVAHDDLGVALARFMELFKEVPGQQFSNNHPAYLALREAAQQIARLLPDELAGAKVKPSVGLGNWASIPWIAVLHPAVTNSTQEGVYPVLLFHPDMDSVEVTIAQGVTKLTRTLGRPHAYERLRDRALALRAELTSELGQGFFADSNYELGASTLGRDYVMSTVVHRRFDRQSLPTSDVSNSVRIVLQAYGDLFSRGLLSNGDQSGPGGPRAVMVYVGQRARANFESGGRDGWWGWKNPPSGLEVLQPGDLIAFGSGYDAGSPRAEAATWQKHQVAEVTVGRITSPIERTDQLVMPDELAGQAAYPWKIRFDHLGTEQNVTLAPGARLSGDASDGLRRSAINRGVGILVPVADSPLLEDYMNNAPRTVDITPPAVAAAASAFVSAVEQTGMLLRSGDAQAFLAALMTKPFAILTGLSGSGKTQLAKRVGEWFGSDSKGRPRYLVVPVRPDWTGPEYLFGYPDVLRSGGGEEVWAVPDALEFMLRAANEAKEPFLLLLDEMNLAHVERYFADFLSGVESREPILPELKLHDGRWMSIGNSQRLPMPRNLFVAGTVNVDETTYLFSPKVLDRAFTFEFRTSATELDPALRRPGAASAAASEHRAVVAAVAANDDWHHDHPHSEQEALVEDLRKLHEILTDSGHEFGHRVLYESLRYAALLGGIGFTSRAEVLDRVVLTKLLPKMHGTRSRLEKPLADLLDFAQGSGGSTEPVLPLTASKAGRMLAVLREAQFVSFTE